MTKRPDELLPTRASLLKRLRNWQDQASWQDFFNTYWKLIYGVARKAGLTDAEAQDVLQETLVSVAKHIPTFKYDPTIGSFKAWLLNMTRWRIVGQFRKRGALVAHEPLPGNSIREPPALIKSPTRRARPSTICGKWNGRRTCWRQPSRR